MSRCGPLSGCVPRRQEALPASLETHSVALPCSRTPGGPPRQTISAFRCCPRYSYHEGSPNVKDFEALSHGFTTRCLRLKTSFLNANQGSLPVDGQSFPGGSVPPGLTRGFLLLATSSSPFGSLFRLTSAIPASQGFGWRQGNPFLAHPRPSHGSDRDGGGAGGGRGEIHPFFVNLSFFRLTSQEFLAERSAIRTSCGRSKRSFGGSEQNPLQI